MVDVVQQLHSYVLSASRLCKRCRPLDVTGDGVTWYIEECGYFYD